MREHCLLQTRNQVQREGPEREGKMATVRTAAFFCHALRHLFCRSPCSTCLCPPHLAPCQLFCALGSPSRATACGLSEKSSGKAPQTPKLPSQPDRQFALLDVRSHPSLCTPFLPLLLPILSRGALAELLPLGSCLLLSVQLPQGLHQVGGSSWVTCKTGRRISPQQRRSRSSALLWIAGYYKRSSVARHGQ